MIETHEHACELVLELALHCAESAAILEQPTNPHQSLQKRQGLLVPPGVVTIDQRNHVGTEGEPRKLDIALFRDGRTVASGTISKIWSS